MSDTANDPRFGSVPAEDVRTLVDIGYIALSAGLDLHAAAIFEGVQAVRPNHEAGFIGRAVVDIARGDAGAAIKALRSLPPTDTAQTFLAITLIHYGDHEEARKLLVEVIGSAADTSAAALARDVMAELDAPANPRRKGVLLN